MNMGRPETIWAIPAIHGEFEKLQALHDQIFPQIRPGDRLIYLGNYLGHNTGSNACIDEILAFRRMVLALPGMITQDVVYLRGSQEEMWQKLLQLQFAPDPTNVLLWMLGNGLAGTLESYGVCPHDGIEACRQGTMSITKWTGAIRQAIRKQPGHEVFGTQLLRAAYTAEDNPCPMLFVHAGIDTSRPLYEQNDEFWWAGSSFSTINRPYTPFQKVIRGYDPGHRGMQINGITASIDGGCGFGGNLNAIRLGPDGSVSDVLET